MPPVAMSRRAGPLLVRFLTALLFSMPVAVQASEAEPSAPAASPQAGLKLPSPAALAGGRFKFDGAPDGADDDEAAGLAGGLAPRPVHKMDKSDYALPATLPVSGGAFREQGLASWYGKGFHGRKTSSGDPYDMYAMTAAHPSLPIPSYVRVTNLSNGRSAVVRVNDRGPFHPGRIIDLSYAAAYKLGYLDQGQASVEVALVLPEDVALVQPARPVPPMRKARAVAAARQPAAPVPVEPSRPSAVEAQVVAVAPPPVAVSAAPVAVAPVAVAGKAPERAGAQVFLQLASFPSLPTAESFKVFVEGELKWLKESVQVLSLEGKYRLHVGPFASAGEARTMAERIAGVLKLKPFIVQR